MAANPQVRLLLACVFIAYLAQTSLNPIIAPLSREVGLAEWQVGVTISVAASMLVLTSGLWGRRSQSVGRKPVLLTAFIIGSGATALFAVSAQLGLLGLVSGTALFVLFLLLRGLALGAAISAIVPTAQAYIADVTPDEASRVKGMAGIGAVQGLSMVGGSIVGGVLAAFGLITPLVVVPLLLAGGVIVVLLRLPREPRTTLIERPARVRPTDRRIWPFLVAGFGMFTALGFIQVITGFIVLDRLGVDAKTAGVLTGVAMLTAGLGIIAAQAGVVPRTGWGPATLLRVGCAIALVGFVILVPELGAVPLFVSMGVIGLGLGIAMPGYSAGPSMLVERHEQGGMAGLVAATTGLTFVIAPTIGTVLYGVWPTLPVLIGAVIIAAVTGFVLLHPRFRRLPAPAPESTETPISS